jgi:hypothetical protein
LNARGRSKPGVVSNYLARYAEPEARELSQIEGQWESVVCIPACQEEHSLLDTLRQMAQIPGAKSTLVIVVINGRENASEAVHSENSRTETQLRSACESPEDSNALLCMGGMSVWMIDRYSPGHRISNNQGVGLARKIAADIALDLIHKGQIQSPWIRCTDADVEIPESYFSAGGEWAEQDRPSAFVYPFIHSPEGDALQAKAMRIYEGYLHYYVAGLQRAGSPYAFHTIGSLIVINATSYAVVRGFPRRQAGEDFYLLNKLAKVGAVVQLEGQPVRIRGRVSNRVPFGTGAAVQAIRDRLVDGLGYTVYNPAVFDALGIWVNALKAFSEHGDRALLEQMVCEGDPRLGKILVQALRDQGAFLAAGKASQQVSGPQLLRRLMEWNDAFRTLKLIHALRDAGLGEVSFDDVDGLGPSEE